MINWLHRYISDHLIPLTELTAKNMIFEWTDEAEKSFIQIKKLVANAKFLRHPDPSKQFYVLCDASNTGIGACLMQKHNGMLHPCEFWSKFFDKTQRHWYTGEKELASIVYSLEKFHKHLIGNKFIVFNDHKNLANLQRYSADNLLNQKFKRWLIRIKQFDFDCYYTEGIRMFLPDYLSRTLIATDVMRDTYALNPSRRLSNAPIMYPESSTASSEPSFYSKETLFCASTNSNDSLRNDTNEIGSSVCLVDGDRFHMCLIAQKATVFTLLRRSQRLEDKRRLKEATSRVLRESVTNSDRLIGMDSNATSHKAAVDHDCNVPLGDRQPLDSGVGTRSPGDSVCPAPTGAIGTDLSSVHASEDLQQGANPMNPTSRRSVLISPEIEEIEID